jgi:hypothetical protein
VALNRNDRTLARDRFVEALRIRQDIGSQPGIATSLDGLAMLEIASDNWEKGLAILEAAQAFRDRIGSRRLTVWQDDIDVARSVALEKLSPECATRAEAQGKQLTVEEATALALG